MQKASNQVLRCLWGILSSATRTGAPSMEGVSSFDLLMQPPFAVRKICTECQRV